MHVKLGSTLSAGSLQTPGSDYSNCICSYILSIENEQDLRDFVLEILGNSQQGEHTEADTQTFVTELLLRQRSRDTADSLPTDLQLYKKSVVDDDYIQGKQQDKRNRKKQDKAIAEDSHVQRASPLDEPKKKSKFVSLYSSEGESASVVQLPGRHRCDCQAAKHRLISNCMSCGRIVCEQEGSGPCLFCQTLVCTREEQDVINRNSKKSEKLRKKLMMNTAVQDENRPSDEHLSKALAHKDRLLEFDKTCVSRTKVIDDQSDYFAVDGNRWLSSKERETLRKKEAELREKKNPSRRGMKITLDIAGRRIKEEDRYDLSATEEVQDWADRVSHGRVDPSDASRSLGFPASNSDMLHPLVDNPPKFIPTGLKSAASDVVGHSDSKRAELRLQDGALQEMSDKGCCMSMHQPWASLLIKGIKRDEGRTWYSAHRGRLWIAAGVKEPSHDEIKSVERECSANINGNVIFPEYYPTSCLLGCVDIDDVLPQEQYRVQYKDGDSTSPYVFVCRNPQELLFKFPIKGQHKIYKLESHIHKAATKCMNAGQ
ncbi:PREDICTED: activating signal cointegrator 1-like [Priapulus caudatus]|uniref:Activating signal cointegrator 1-like n=1 Tax=Priapulus caudatus TaxID=37621 RepID=A0ABM1EWG7_PRICU|nr:PREDICTED: activating signal cointegrator 1-like [Priapulus caudatus]